MYLYLFKDSAEKVFIIHHIMYFWENGLHERL